MKRSITKVVSLVIAAILIFTAIACVASAEDEVEYKVPRDIYLVLDVSGSMSGTPIVKLKDAAKQFCGLMLNDTTGDNQIAIITYGTEVEYLPFTSNYAELANYIDSFSAKGSTAMYDALEAVKEVGRLYGRSFATNHVVVMADGLPNEGPVLSSGKYTAKDSSMYYKHGNAVYSDAASMWPNHLIYSIGFFHNLGGNQLKYGKVLMKDIQNALYLEVFDPDKILEAFTGVADKITGNGNDNTTVTPTAAPTVAPTVAPTGAPTTNGKQIPQTGDGSVGIVIAAALMISGIAVVATKKRED